MIYQEWDLIFTVKTSVCWVTARSVEGTHILKIESIISFYRDTKYPLEINLMELVIQGAHFSKELLKLIFIEIGFQ